jgi:hypothetical protein
MADLYSEGVWRSQHCTPGFYPVQSLCKGFSGILITASFTLSTTNTRTEMMNIDILVFLFCSFLHEIPFFPMKFLSSILLPSGLILG